MGTLRLPRINDFDDPELIPRVIVPLQKMADKKSQEELANLFLASIYGYVNARCRAHARKLANKGITNISYENISSEVNWRLARSLYGIEWDRSPKEIKIYVVQQINFGLKEADRMAGKMTRREYRHVNKAATIINEEEQRQGRTLNRSEIEEIIRSSVKDTSKTKWSEIALNALDPGEGIAKQHATSDGNGLDSIGGNIVEIETANSAEEAWFTGFRFENLARIIEEWVENDIRDDSLRNGLMNWLADQRGVDPFEARLNSPNRSNGSGEGGDPSKEITWGAREMSGSGSTSSRFSKAGIPAKVVNEIGAVEKRKLLERCDAAGIDDIRIMVSEILMSEMEKTADYPEEMRLPF